MTHGLSNTAKSRNSVVLYKRKPNHRVKIADPIPSTCRINFEVLSCCTNEIFLQANETWISLEASIARRNEIIIYIRCCCGEGIQVGRVKPTWKRHSHHPIQRWAHQFSSWFSKLTSATSSQNTQLNNQIWHRSFGITAKSISNRKLVKSISEHANQNTDNHLLVRHIKIQSLGIYLTVTLH